VGVRSRERPTTRRIVPRSSIAAGDAGAKPAIEAPTSGTRAQRGERGEQLLETQAEGTGSATPPITAGSSTSRSTCT
jgi:hypothetical protein